MGYVPNFGTWHGAVPVTWLVSSLCVKSPGDELRDAGRKQKLRLAVAQVAVLASRALEVRVVLEPCSRSVTWSLEAVYLTASLQLEEPTPRFKPSSAGGGFARLSPKLLSSKQELRKEKSAQGGAAAGSLGRCWKHPAGSCLH